MEDDCDKIGVPIEFINKPSKPNRFKYEEVLKIFKEFKDSFKTDLDKDVYEVKLFGERTSYPMICIVMNNPESKKILNYPHKYAGIKVEVVNKTPVASKEFPGVSKEKIDKLYAEFSVFFS